MNYRILITATHSQFPGYLARYVATSEPNRRTDLPPYMTWWQPFFTKIDPRRYYLTRLKANKCNWRIFCCGKESDVKITSRAWQTLTRSSLRHKLFSKSFLLPKTVCSSPGSVKQSFNLCAKDPWQCPLSFTSRTRGLVTRLNQELLGILQVENFRSSPSLWHMIRISSIWD